MLLSKMPAILAQPRRANTFAPSKASCQRPPATLHGVVFHISVGSANRLDLAAQVVANAALSPHPCVTAPPLSLEEPRLAPRLEGRGRGSASRTHGSPGDAKHRPETAHLPLPTMRVNDAVKLICPTGCGLTNRKGRCWNCPAARSR